jgi:hypothetical protein
MAPHSGLEILSIRQLRILLGAGLPTTAFNILSCI